MTTPAHTPSEKFKLLPHQTGLIETFFEPSCKRKLLLKSEVGLGRHAAVATLVNRFYSERPTARILYLVPAACREQIARMLSDSGAMVRIVDRYCYREMLDAADSGAVWPTESAFILSIDFAKQPDIAESLVKCRWDLLIAEEGHLFKGARLDLLRKLVSCSDRVLMTIMAGLIPPDIFSPADTTSVIWRRNQVVDSNGKTLDTAARPVVQSIVFELTPAELRLQEAVRELNQIIHQDTDDRSWLEYTLSCSLESSPTAVEGVLHRLLKSPQDSGRVIPSQRLPDDESKEVESVGVSEVAATEQILGGVKRALDEIEELAVDSKLNALEALLSQIAASGSPGRRICIVVTYVASLHYLSAAIENRGITCQVLHGGMDPVSRNASLTSFREKGGVLIATAAIMAVSEGLSTTEITDLILYDIPESMLSLRQIVGRCDRFGRRTQLKVHGLIRAGASNDSLPRLFDDSLDVEDESTSGTEDLKPSP